MTESACAWIAPTLAPLARMASRIDPPTGGAAAGAGVIGATGATDAGCSSAGIEDASAAARSAIACSAYIERAVGEAPTFLLSVVLYSSPSLGAGGGGVTV